MSAAMKLVNQPFAQTGVVTGQLVEGRFNNVSRFEAAPDKRLRRALKYIADLQDEISVLREALARSERGNAHYETLLRNAIVRERELRAQLASARF